jgi:O-antigen chain-terminating methyltransferase
MLDVKNPEIKVDDIMRRIQEKIRLRPEPAAIRQEPRAAFAPGASAPDSSRMINQLLVQAQELARVGMTLPPMSRMRGLKRTLATQVAKIFLRLAQLVTRDQRAFNEAVVAALRAIFDRLSQEGARTAQIADRLSREVGAAREELTGKIAQDIAALGQLEGRVRTMDQEAESGRRTHAVALSQLRTTISLQDRRLTLLLEEVKKRLPHPLDDEQLQTFAEELPHVADASYLSFEDEFRGSREEIKGRVAVYLPKLRGAEAGTEKWPILDVGCGRGELLEVLRKDGLKASGVDTNSAAVDCCRKLELDVELGDAFAVLSKIPDGSLGGLTALHVIEHLPFPLVLKLLDEALRVLRPGGIAIFETPNPKNILVGASNFYIDPTHRNPVHPQTLRYLMEARGMIQIESLMLHPYPKEMHVPEGDSVVARLFNEYFYGPQDYAVLGHRP